MELGSLKEAVVPAEIMVVKRDASREEFNPEKLRAGIRHACWKRSVSEEQIDSMVDAIAGKLIAMQQREVGSEQIGELAMAVLQEVDEVAYVRFASIYRRFKRVDQFINELQNLSDRKPRHPALLPEE